MTRHLAIGDIHGCYQALESLIEFVDLQPDDVIITLGDYVDRGPDSRGVIDWLLRVEQSHRLIPLRGNHDVMMLEARDDRATEGNWREFGGEETLRSYAAPGQVHGKMADVLEEHWDFLQHRLLDYWEGAGYFCVHAGAVADLPLSEQPDYMLYWEKLRDPPLHESGKIMICGHTSQKSGLPWTNKNAICIDTWVYGDGWLTCLEIETGQLWQTNQNGDRRRLHWEDLVERDWS